MILIFSERKKTRKIPQKKTVNCVGTKTSGIGHLTAPKLFLIGRIFRPKILQRHSVSRLLHSAQQPIKPGPPINEGKFINRDF